MTATTTGHKKKHTQKHFPCSRTKTKNVLVKNPEPMIMLNIVLFGGGLVWFVTSIPHLTLSVCDILYTVL